MPRASILLLLLLIFVPLSLAENWNPVPTVDWSNTHLKDFSDDELDLPYLLHNFHTVANAIIEEGPNRGFISQPVWRGRDKNQQGPWNARVMESHLSLAFFYCTDRPWNPYFASPAVRQRLEAMLTFWCNMQNEDGRFSEYGPQQWNLPATAFATKFMGQTLTLLRDSKKKATIDEALHKRVIAADRKAILATLTRDDLYEHGKRFTNQYLNVFAGASAWLDLYPDDQEIRTLVDQKFPETIKDFLSPCGYFYEADGPDFGYTLNTTHSDLEMTYHYFHGKPLGDLIEQEDRAWNDWLGYNLLRQPDGSTWVINRGIETRQHHADWARQEGALCERVESARAFASSREEIEKFRREKRESLAKNWGQFPDLPIGKPGSPYSPYAFLHRGHPPYYPTAAQRDEAIAKLPYNARDRFIHQRADSRKAAVFTYIRRTGYYAAINTGPQITAQQRLGLGIIWTPKDGTIFQTQSNSADEAWGTRPDGAPSVFEAGDLAATFAIDGRDIKPQIGNHDLPDGRLKVTYALGDAGKKTIEFTDDAIEVHVEHPGKFTEQIPLIAPANGDPRIVIATNAPQTVHKSAGPFDDVSLHIVTLTASDFLTYTIKLR